MNIPPSTSNNRPTQLTDVPLAVKTDIVKRVHDAIVEETTTRDSSHLAPIHVAQKAAREAARALAKLNLVNHDLRNVTKQAMDELPNAGMTATSMAIHKMTNNSQFQQRFIHLVQSSKHIEVPFSDLSRDEWKIVLEVLSRKERTQHLEKAKLNLCDVKLDASLNQNLLETIHAMSRNGHQNLDIDLNLNCTTMNDQYVTALAEVLPQCKVSSLQLNDNEIGKKGAIAIANALPHSSLINLDLSFNYRRHITDEGVSAIANALPHSRLTSLNLSSNEIGDEGTSSIARALPHSSLTSLNWRDNKIGDVGASSIANALPGSSLTDLDFRSNQIGDEGASSIARALPHSQLTKLDLCLNKIEDAGAKAIAEALPASSLTSLDLCRNKIKDDGVIAIAQAVSDSKLTRLNVSSNEIMWAFTEVHATRIALQGPNPPAVKF